MIRFIKQKKLLVVLLVFILVLLPLALTQKAETDKLAVVTAIGLDLKDDNILMSANIVVPNSGQAGSSGGTDGTVKTVSVLGQDVSTAFANLSLLIGKIPGLAHCDALILNKDLFKEDVTKYIDFFVRTNNLTSNANIIIAEDDAKSVIETSAEQKGLRAVSLSKILLLNNEYTLGEESNIDAFYEQYFTAPSATLIPILTSGDSKNADSQTTIGSGGAEGDKTESNQDGQDSSKNSVGVSSNSGKSAGGGTEGDSASGRAQSIIKNQGKGAVVKNGKIKAVLDTQQMYDYNLINPKTRKGHLRVENVTTDGFKNATLCFEIFDKKNKNTGLFLGNNPVFNFDMDLIVKLEEVVMENFVLENMISVKDYVSGDIRTALERSIKEQVGSIVGVAQDTNTDFLGVYEYFHKFYTKQWREFLDGLKDPNDYLKYITFTCDIDMEGKI